MQLLVERLWSQSWREPCRHWLINPSVYLTTLLIVDWSLCRASTTGMMDSSSGKSSTGRYLDSLLSEKHKLIVNVYIKTHSTEVENKVTFFAQCASQMRLGVTSNLISATRDFSLEFAFPFTPVQHQVCDVHFLWRHDLGSDGFCHCLAALTLQLTLPLHWIQLTAVTINIRDHIWLRMFTTPLIHCLLKLCAGNIGILLQEWQRGPGRLWATELGSRHFWTWILFQRKLSLYDKWCNFLNQYHNAYHLN